MPLLKRLEARMRRWAIPNLTGLIVAGQVLLFVVQMARNQGGGVDAFAGVRLDPALVLHGEVWRLVTFAFVPFSMNIINAFFGWMMFYFFGSALENQWGTVRYNTFLLIGVVANIAAAFVAWAVGSFAVASNYFLYTTVFLAFAQLFPGFIINLFFILPIQIRWLALLTWIGLAYGLVVGDWMNQLLIVASILNYLVFFGPAHWREVKQGQRRRSFEALVQKSTRSAVHVCRVCGLDSDASPKTAFRYCSKCAGQCCYCPEHIQSHEHVVVDDEVELADAEKR